MNISDLPRVDINKLQTFKGRCQELYKIQTKKGGLKPFNFIETQEYLDDIVEEEFKRTKKENGYSQFNGIVLKPRQFGGTTYFSVRSLDMQINDEGSNGSCIAHDNQTTEKVYKIFLRAYDNLPEHIVPTLGGQDMTKRDFFEYSLSKDQVKELGFDLKKEEFDITHTIKIKPDTTHYSGRRVGFEDLDNITEIFTAGKGSKGGLGGTVKRNHLTEAGSYQSYKELMQALRPSVPKFADNVLFVLESTANGISGDGEGFYKAWEKAVKGWEKYQRGEVQTYRGLRPIFIPWYMIKEYELSLAGGEFVDISEVDFGNKKLKEEYLQREQKMMTDGIYNPLSQEMQVLTPEKINWYRNIMVTDAEFEYSAARMFYPTTPEDAFAATTNCFFDTIRLDERKHELENEEINEQVGTLAWNGNGDLDFIETNDGSLTIWENPKPLWKNRYVIGVDIATGYAKADYSVATVKDVLEQRYVAMWFGHCDQISFSEIVSNLGIYYNEALLVPESNMNTLVETIKPDGTMPYIGEIYYQGQFPNVRWGYRTHTDTRTTLIDTHKNFLRENPLGYGVIRNLKIWDEHKNFIRVEKSDGSHKYEAASNHHDDILLSQCLADVGETFLDNLPEKHKPSRVKELIQKVTPRTNRYKRNAKIGRR